MLSASSDMDGPAEDTLVAAPGSGLKIRVYGFVATPNLGLAADSVDFALWDGVAYYFGTAAIPHRLVPEGGPMVCMPTGVPLFDCTENTLLGVDVQAVAGDGGTITVWYDVVAASA